jgi:AraC-like DNA-binding protein
VSVRSFSAADWLDSGRRPVVMRRRPLFVRDGRVGIGQTFSVAGEHEAVLATPHYWFASIVDVRAGTLGFRDGHGLRPVSTGRFLLYLPGGSLVRMVLSAAQVETVGITSGVAHATWPKVPLAIPTELQLKDAECEEKLSEVLLRCSIDAERIDADFGLPPSTQRLRQRLLDRALGPTPVTRVARESKLSLPVLSRTFSAAFGVSPRSYCQRLRIYAAAVSLLGGVSITETALRSGWQDLSRFYRQFRGATGQTPGRYRTAGAQRFVK